MKVDVRIEDARTVAEYASIPIAFRVERVVDVDALVASRGSRVESRAIAKGWLKDYDAYPDNGPIGWTTRFGLDRWGFFAAQVDGERVGGAAVASRRDARRQRSGVSILLREPIRSGRRERGCVS